MKKNGFSHIRKWLWSYTFVVVIITSTVFGLTSKEIYDLLNIQNWNGLIDLDPNVQSSLIVLLSGIKIRILFIMAVGILTIFCFSVAWFRFVLHRINLPIYTIRRAVYRLAQGKLNETVSIESNDEFGQIGANINELAANLQELLLHIWKQTGQCIIHLKDIEQSVSQNGDTSSNADTLKHLEALTSAVENLREMAKAYVFYDVHLDGEQTLAINNPGQEIQSEVPKDLSGYTEE